MRYFSFAFWCSGYFVGAYYVADSSIGIAVTGATAMFWGCLFTNFVYGGNK